MSTLVSAASKNNLLCGGAFAADVRRGLTAVGQKTLPSTYFYDHIGSALFEAITQLDEYGLTRADEQVLRTHAPEIAARSGTRVQVAELGSGSGSKTRWILEALGTNCVAYYPIDVSPAALGRCARELGRYAEVRPIEGTYLDGLSQVISERDRDTPLLVLFLGSTIGNFDQAAAVTFLADVRSRLLPGDKLLLGADLVKPIPKMLVAYDDPTGVTAAFNRNLLARINRELRGNFDLRQWTHQALWNDSEQRIEMHLRSEIDQTVNIPGAYLEVRFTAGETIWTEASHKFTHPRLWKLAADCGFRVDACWTNPDWPFTECLWTAA